MRLALCSMLRTAVENLPLEGKEKISMKKTKFRIKQKFVLIRGQIFVIRICPMDPVWGSFDICFYRISFPQVAAIHQTS